MNIKEWEKDPVLRGYGALLGSKSNVLTFSNMNIEKVLLLAITF